MELQLESFLLVLQPGLVIGVLVINSILGRNSLVEAIPLQIVNWFEFRVFYFLDWLQYQG